MGNAATLSDFYALAVQSDFPDVIILHPDDFFLLFMRVLPEGVGRDGFGPKIKIFGTTFRPKMDRLAGKFEVTDLSKERLFSE